MFPPGTTRRMSEYPSSWTIHAYTLSSRFLSHFLPSPPLPFFCGDRENLVGGMSNVSSMSGICRLAPFLARDGFLPPPMFPL